MSQATAEFCTQTTISHEEHNTTNSTRWPRKVNVFGVDVTPTTYDEATDAIIGAAKCGERGLVSCYAAHPLVEASRNDDFRKAANSFDMITPDGQPVRWAMNILHKTKLKDRVYGPDLTLRLCRSAEEQGVSIYLYGGSPDVIITLKNNLLDMFPGLEIAGYESPPYRKLTEEEDIKVIDRINNSGAGIVLIGLGCPKQDFFAYEHRNTINSVQVCVGAAFDFHAGVKKIAPQWMQRSGLEWLFRLSQEPKRLCRRYFVTNSLYILKLARACVTKR